MLRGSACGRPNPRAAWPGWGVARVFRDGVAGADPMEVKSTAEARQTNGPGRNEAEEAAEAQLRALLHAMQAMKVGEFSARLPSDWTGVMGKVDRKSTRLNSSHLGISYGVLCLKEKRSRRNEQMRGPMW